jgi:hypothetical protein
LAIGALNPDFVIRRGFGHAVILAAGYSMPDHFRDSASAASSSRTILGKGLRGKARQIAGVSSGRLRNWTYEPVQPIPNMASENWLAQNGQGTVTCQPAASLGGRILGVKESQAFALWQSIR